MGVAGHLRPVWGTTLAVVPVTATLALFVGTVALCAGGLVVIAVLCVVRSWMEARRAR